MARLLEFEAKQLFAAAGMPVPAGDVAATPEDARRIASELGGRVAVKAQVPIGKRAAAGGIRLTDTADEAAAATEDLVGADLLGFQVERVLVEARHDISEEYYLAVFSNPTTRTPTVIFSRSGGTGVEDAAAEANGLATLDVDLVDGVRLYHAYDLLGRAGVSRSQLVPLAQIVVRLFETYRRYDCTLAEINPLAVTENGLLAIDARIGIDDDALFRHRDLGIEATEEVGDRLPTAFEEIAGKIDANDHRGSAHFVQIDPDGSLAREGGKVPIGFDGVGTGVSLTAMDELVPLGFLPKNFCDTSGNPTASKMYRITRIILSQPGIEGYVFVSCLSSQQLDNTARGIVKAFKEIYSETGGAPNLPCVLCFRGAWDETALQMFEDHGIAQGAWVRLLGRDATEREVALAFRDLHTEWRMHRSEGAAA